MTDFQPGDIVRHQSGVTGTLDQQHYGDWWATDWDGQRRYWFEDHITLVERPYPGTFDHIMSDVSIDERGAPIWGWVFLLVAVVVLTGATWLGIYLVGLL